MLITRKETYMLGNAEFSTLRHVREHVENSIGDIIDKVQPRLAPKQRLQLLELLIDNRKMLCEFLGAAVESRDFGIKANSIFEDNNCEK